MPHFLIEYSANVAEHHDVDGLVARVHEAAIDTGALPLAGLRTRAVARYDYRIASGDPSFAFVALHARIGPGRTPEMKKAILTEILDAAEAHLTAEVDATLTADSGSRRDTPLTIAWSAELTEIDVEFRMNRNHIRPLLEEGT